MFRTSIQKAASAALRPHPHPHPVPKPQTFATIAPVTSGQNHKVVVIGGGTAGLSISHQLLRSGRFTPQDIAVVDPATWHHYQPGWTLVGGGLKTKEELRRPMHDLVHPDLKFYNDGVRTFSPEDNTVTLSNGDRVTYEQLVVVPGIQIQYDKIKGLPEALAASDSLVSSIYGYDTCDKVFRTIQQLRKGTALFTQPTGVVKCAGAPQKAMWLALDHWKRKGLYNVDQSQSDIQISFATALPAMFGIPKYSVTLEKLRQKNNVEGLFQHDLVEIDGNTAVFAQPNGQQLVRKHYDLLHVVPKMGPYSFVKDSALANGAGFVDVDESTMRHTRYANVWSAGDASSLPTSKTMAAVAAQAPVLVQNLLRVMDGRDPSRRYDGYTSCPLVTQYGKVLLAEFKYGGVPKETFAMLGIDQAVPRRAFYYMKKYFFPWVYYNSMVKGTWGGSQGWLK
ncbi:putative pyridine nucleotide-disulfide oxidoreductase [Aspergillus sclerotioniger CBS 115572]|uniref:Putative pyridine nucleotide-disulfide oxidoreductase n=1 Tax=Aspergillus sclerotioniger CBS 115572 TaxID=1450535 RepID=A0A317W5F2_9EURO|nr:putative pyridine nucleotide-disulfide oxidoreductase [Aspergillus sclerotioniger CBS 115572]PWY81573.1 putative pyridine nucleotide-disulfide oxidoreductase [Aspergillus sclerotioniger CBS 115572]